MGKGVVMKPFYGILFVALFTAGSVMAGTKRGEQYIAVYGGFAAISSGTVKGRIEQFGLLERVPPPYHFSTPYDRSTSGTAGLRIGYWSPIDYEIWEWGLAGDMSFFRAQSTKPDTDINVLPISLLALLRYPMLVSKDYPHGRTYPYLGIGPSVVTAKITTEAIHDNGSRVVSVTDIGVGFDLRTGWAWRLSERADWFVEYRFLAAHISGSNEDYRALFADRIDLSTSFTSHHLLSGLSFRF